jgi:hypothetical protein
MEAWAVSMGSGQSPVGLVHVLKRKRYDASAPTWALEQAPLRLLGVHDTIKLPGSNFLVSRRFIDENN